MQALGNVLQVWGVKGCLLVVHHLLLVVDLQLLGLHLLLWHVPHHIKFKLIKICLSLHLLNCHSVLWINLNNKFNKEKQLYWTVIITTMILMKMKLTKNFVILSPQQPQQKGQNIMLKKDNNLLKISKMLRKLKSIVKNIIL